MLQELNVPQNMKPLRYYLRSAFHALNRPFMQRLLLLIIATTLAMSLGCTILLTGHTDQLVASFMPSLLFGQTAGNALSPVAGIGWLSASSGNLLRQKSYEEKE